MFERDIERALCQRVSELSGMCEKFTSANRKGVPDRIISLPGGVIIFVECKAPGARPTRLQLRDHARRRALGFDVRVIDNLGVANAFPN